MASPTLHGPWGRTEEQRFLDMVDRKGYCWEWLGGKKQLGYGQFAIKRDGKWTRAIAHRYAYELWVGPIPGGFEVDHLCFNPGCQRPDHLEAVTTAENLRRKKAHTLAKSHCRVGHAFAVTGRYADGKCSECVRLRNRAKYGGRPPFAERTHCPAGHPYAGDNLRIVTRKDGGVGRRCRTCDNRRNMEQYRRRKAKAA